MNDDSNTRRVTVQMRTLQGEYDLLRAGFKDKITKCPRCDGSGAVSSIRRGREIERECPKCDGTGEYCHPWSSAARNVLVEAAAEDVYPDKTVDEAIETALEDGDARRDEIDQAVISELKDCESATVEDLRYLLSERIEVENWETVSSLARHKRSKNVKTTGKGNAKRWSLTARKIREIEK